MFEMCVKSERKIQSNGKKTLYSLKGAIGLPKMLICYVIYQSSIKASDIRVSINIVVLSRELSSRAVPGQQVLK